MYTKLCVQPKPDIRKLIDAYMQVVAIHIIIFDDIAMTKDLSTQIFAVYTAVSSGIVLSWNPIPDCNSPADYKSPADYTSFVIQKIAE